MFGVRKGSGVVLLSLVIFVGSVAARRAMADEPLLRLYFVPFANIEEHGYTIWFLEVHPFIPKLTATLKSRPTKRQILSNGIRLEKEIRYFVGVVDVKAFKRVEGVKQ